MPVRLEININDETRRVLRWAELEQGRPPAEVLFVGTQLLKIIEHANPVQIWLIDQDGAATEIESLTPEVPGEIYDF